MTRIHVGQEQVEFGKPAHGQDLVAVAAVAESACIQRPAEEEPLVELKGVGR